MFFQCKMQDLYSIGENFVICAFANNFRLFFTYVSSGNHHYLKEQNIRSDPTLQKKTHYFTAKQLFDHI